MLITISPVAGLPGQAETTLSVDGDTLTVDGIAFDLSAVPEAGQGIPDGSHPFVGTITRSGGEIVATVRCVYDTTTAEAHQSTDPADWIVSVGTGAIVLPVQRKGGAA